MYDFSPLLPFGIEAHQDYTAGKLVIHAHHIELIDDLYLTDWDIQALVQRHIVGLDGAERIKGKPFRPYVVINEKHYCRIKRMKGKQEEFLLYPGRGEVEISFRRPGYYHLVAADENVNPHSVIRAARAVKRYFITTLRFHELPVG